MPMFHVIYESNGETVATAYWDGSNPDEARARFETFLHDYPEYDFRAKYAGLVVRVEVGSP
jgi:hypothetical protein